ncbi:uncharacterized protein LOC144428023 [Styela clava]
MDDLSMPQCNSLEVDTVSAKERLSAGEIISDEEPPKKLRKCDSKILNPCNNSSSENETENLTDTEIDLPTEIDDKDDFQSYNATPIMKDSGFETHWLFSKYFLLKTK